MKVEEHSPGRGDADSASERICTLARRGDWLAVHREARALHSAQVAERLATFGRRGTSVCRRTFGALRMAVRGLAHAVHLGGRSPRKA
jgi:hypothetical protein